MKNLKFKPYQKLLVLFEQKAKLRTSAPFGYVELSVEEIENSLANEIHMYRLSTYIWHIKVNVGGIVSSVRGDTPETKRKVVSYELCNVNEVADRLKVMGIVDASQTLIDVPATTNKKFRPKKVKKLTDLNAQLSEALKTDETVEKVEERVI